MRTSTGMSHQLLSQSKGDTFLHHYSDFAPGVRATDATDERDFAPQQIQRHAMPSLTLPQSENPATPSPAHIPSMDGHHSINHPDDRPRAKHPRTSTTTDNYEMSSDAAYRHGPDAESGTTSGSWSDETTSSASEGTKARRSA
jgi:aquaporin related protein